DAYSVRGLNGPVGRAEHLLHDASGRPDGRARDLGPLPQILVSRLRHRHVEPLAERRRERVERAALLLEGVTPGKVQIPPLDTDPHDRFRRSAPRAAGGALRRRLERPLDLFHAERLDPVTDLQVVEVLDADAALEPFADLAHVVLEALEARERAGVHRGA